MLNHFSVLLLLTSSMVFGISIIDSGRRTDFNQITNNELKTNDIGVIQDDCTNLTPELIAEIQSHQPIVDDIVRAIVNGTYSGDTWNA